MSNEAGEFVKLMRAQELGAMIVNVSIASLPPCPCGCARISGVLVSYGGAVLAMTTEEDYRQMMADLARAAAAIGWKAAPDG